MPPPRGAASIGDTLFFSARDGTHGAELWRSDGTDEGTVLVEDINFDARVSGPHSLTPVGSRLFLFVRDGAHEPALWRSDGTETGTVLVKDVDTLAPDYGPPPVGAAGALFFVSDDGVHGAELWRSDGTEAGTVLLKDINPGDGDGDPHYYDAPDALTTVAGTVFFTADDGVRGTELWRSDGTEAGTVLVDDINRGGHFRVAAKPTANTRNGTLRVRVRTAGAGRLEVAPARGALIKESAKRLREAGSTRITVRPTAAGMRKLERALRQARRDGDKVGKVRISARFIFTPCGGDPNSQTRRFTLKLR